MTTYVAIYDDSEYDVALPATKTVVNIHRRLGMPATFGIVTEPLENDPALARAYHDLLCDPADDGLFDIVPHSHTHPLFFDHKTLGTGISHEQAEFEISHSKKLIEDIFERPVTGFRSTNGFYGGWASQPQLLQVLVDNGCEFLSSDAMGPGDTVPAPLTQPYFYAEAGFPNLLEIPGHDWHDNVLSGYNIVPAAWPPCVPAGLPNRPPETPREKFEVYRPNLDWCVENQAAFYSPALHPFSIRRFEPEGTWVEMLLRHAQEIGMNALTMSDFAAQWRAQNRP
jgi:peptidoglycan/xylan/chitin deacetylase (PgdA/CDA1 family)